MRASQLVDVELGRVDHEVGSGLHRVEQLPLELDGFGDRLLLDAGGMAAPAGAVALQQLGRRRLEEQDAHAVAALAQAVDRVEQIVLRRAGAHHEGQPLRGRAIGAAQLDELLDERDGQVVDDEPAEILEVVGGLRTPAPESPATTMTSLLGGFSAGLVTANQRTERACVQTVFVASRKSRRGMVAASRYSTARARKARRRRRLRHVPHVEPGGGQRVDVAAQRPMDERDEDALLDLFDRLVLDQVGPDAPVLLGRIEHLVVDPAAVRRLQQRVVQEEAEAAAGRQHSADLGDGVVDVTDVLEHQAGDGGVEAARLERQGTGRRARVNRSAAAFDRGRGRPGSTGGVDADRPLGTGAVGGQPGSPVLRRSRCRAPSRAPARCSAASGRICSSYSGSAPSVNPRSTMRRCAPRGRRSLVDLAVHRLGDRIGQPRQGLQLFERGLPHRVHAAHLLHQTLLAGRAEAGHVVEHALGHALVAQLAMEACWRSGAPRHAPAATGRAPRC